MKIEAIGLTLALAGGTLAGCTNSEPAQRPSPPPSSPAAAPSPSPPFGPEVLEPWPTVDACPQNPGVFTWPGDGLPSIRCWVGSLLKERIDQGKPVEILSTPVRIGNLGVGSCVNNPLHLTGKENEASVIYLGLARVGEEGKGAEVLIFPPFDPRANSATLSPVSVVAKPAPGGMYVTPENAAVGALVNAPIC